MGPYRRNFFVGGTILLALITLGFLIIMFGGSLGKVFAGEKIPVSFKSDRGDGISEGSIIRYLGQQVGVVKHVQLILDEFPNHVLISAELDKHRPIPRQTHGSILVLSPLGGSAVIELEVDPKADASAKLVGGELLECKYVGSSVIPPEFSTVASEFAATLRDFRESNLIGEFKKTVQNVNDQVAKAGKVLDSIDAVLGNETTQTDLKLAIGNFKTSTEHLKVTLANAERISEELKTLPAKIDTTVGEVKEGVGDARNLIRDGQQRLATTSDALNRNLAKIAEVLDEMKAITHKINNGEGTVGLLLNDPKLYEKIVTGTEVINETVKDVQRLIRGFEEDGVPINFK